MNTYTPRYCSKCGRRVHGPSQEIHPEELICSQCANQIQEQCEESDNQASVMRAIDAAADAVWIGHSF